ncbi:MAG: SurA N-terminal domain-containing protein [Bacteroidota bacterium]
MALINTLREKMGKVLVIVIFLAIASFVLADIMGPGSQLFGDSNDVGEIAGETISQKEFQQVLDEVESKYILNFQRAPTENERPTLRQQAWELLVVKHAFEKQYEKTGITVTSDEVWDMMQGKNISPSIQQSFVNPNSGEFDRQSFLQYLQNVPNMPVNAQSQWELFKSDLKPGRQRLKFENLLMHSNFVTSLEAKREYGSQNNVAEVKYLYIPFYAVSDSTVEVSDSQLRTYYDENKERYKTDGSRSLKYVSFPIPASPEDSTFIKDELEEMKQELITAQDDSVYANISTDGLTPYGKYHIGILPQQLKDNASGLEVGQAYGPYLDATGKYKIHKVSDIYQDTIEYAKASHILFKGDDEEARQEANRVLREIKNGADFAAMARQYGTDGTAAQGGDLGWKKSGDYVDEFNDAVFNRTTAGLVNNVVKTQFGYHIVKVDEPKTNTAYKIATIEREITPSDETRNEVYREADLFASEVTNLSEFEAAAQEKGYSIAPEQPLKKNDRRIGVLGNARQIAQWLFRDASQGDVSEVYDLDDKYVVAVMTDEEEEGYRDLDKVRTEVTVKVKNELKGEKIIETLKGLTGSLDEMASAYGADASVYNSSDMKLNTSSLPNVGYDPQAVGKAFSLESGEKTAPFASENGVLIIEMINKTNAPEVADYATYKTQLEQTVRNQVSYGISEAIKESADITDKRYKFY